MRLLRVAAALAVPGLLLACGARAELTVDDRGAGGAGEGPPACTIELCNGVDDDCDGEVDEESLNAGADCITEQPGICKSGTVVCAGGALACVPNISPQAEVCGNKIDEDCNGILDDGCPAASNGCSDGTREGFFSIEQFPLIAACAGGWTAPGLLLVPSPQCNHAAGNTSSNPDGDGCSAADLCAPGFHVCKGAADVASRAPGGCAGLGIDGIDGALFFATRQGSTGCGICALGVLTEPDVCNGWSCAHDCAPNDTTANDLFGCGTLGILNEGPCGALDVTSGNLCSALGVPWHCEGPSAGYDESLVVTKHGAAGGGVLCCAD